jgi:hypothetical protein
VESSDLRNDEYNKAISLVFVLVPCNTHHDDDDDVSPVAIPCVATVAIFGGQIKWCFIP